MIESLLALSLFGSFVWALVVLAIFLVFCFVAESEENGFIATIFLAISGGLFYFFGRDTWNLFVSIISWQGLVIYFGAGLAHAFVRVYFHGRKEALLLAEDRVRNSTYEHKIDRDVKGHVFRWWFLWPVSLLTWFLRDMVKEIYTWVYSKFSKTFDYVMDMGVKSVKVPEKKDMEKKTQINK
jgi:hypothetical protein